jgi:hypothetical protein
MLLKGNIHTEEIHFNDGSRQTLKNVCFSEQGSWWHKKTTDGRYYIINPKKVLFVRVYE